jgi:hypothetical protein
MTKEEVEALGYEQARQLEDGAWVAIRPMLFTTALVVDIDRFCYDHRFCFHRREDAEREILRMRTIDDDPTGYIKRKPDPPGTED